MLKRFIVMHIDATRIFLLLLLFAIALSPRPAPGVVGGGVGGDGWSWLGHLTLQKSAFGRRKPRMYPKKIHYGDSA